MFKLDLKNLYINIYQMKTLKFYFTILALACLSIGLNAQANGKVSPALTNFKETEFMKKFQDLRIEAESTVRTINERQDEFEPATLNKLRTYYDQTADRANNVMDGVKNDFLSKKKLKMIVEFPDMYSEGLQFKLNELSDFYSNNFQQTLADAQVIEEDGSVLLLIVELVSLTKGLVDYYSAIKKEARRYNESYLNQHLVAPYRWKTWTMITNGAEYSADDFNSEINLSGHDSREARDRQMSDDIKNSAQTLESLRNGNSSSTDDWDDSTDSDTDDWGDDEDWDDEDWDDDGWDDDTDGGGQKDDGNRFKWNEKPIEKKDDGGGK